MKLIVWRIVLIELFTAQGTPVFSHKTTTVIHQRRARARMRTTTNLCKSTPYDPADPEHETSNNLAIRDSALRAESQGISQQIVPTDKGNSRKGINREKVDARFCGLAVPEV